MDNLDQCFSNFLHRVPAQIMLNSPGAALLFCAIWCQQVLWTFHRHFLFSHKQLCSVYCHPLHFQHGCSKYSPPDLHFSSLSFLFEAMIAVILKHSFSVSSFLFHFKNIFLAFLRVPLEGAHEPPLILVPQFENPGCRMLHLLQCFSLIL